MTYKEAVDVANYERRLWYALSEALHTSPEWAKVVRVMNETPMPESVTKALEEG